jgi:hypothetical protein
VDDVRDAIIIDRVFQPISDRLATWVSCFGISLFLLDGAMVCVIGMFAYAVVVGRSPIFVILMIGCLIYFRMQVSQLARSAEQSQLRNPARWRYYNMRLIGGLFLLFDTGTLPWPACLLQAIFLVALYFASCQYNRPKPTAIQYDRSKPLAA